MRQKLTLLTKTMLLLCALMAGSGSAWAEDIEKTGSYSFSTSGCTGWTTDNAGSYCGGYGRNKNGAYYVMNVSISDFENVDFSSVTSPSVSITVKALTNGGTNSYTVSMVDKDGNVVGTPVTKEDGMGSGTNANAASESTVTLTPVYGTTGYKIDFLAKSAITQTSYTLTYTTSSSSTYSVTYNGNGSDGGTVPTDNNEYESGDEVTVLGAGTMTKTGYDFAWWEDGKGNSYDEGDKFNISSNTTLTAVWNAQSFNYTLTVTGEDSGALAAVEVGGTELDEDDKIDFGSEVTVTVATNDGYRYSIAVKDADNNPVTVSNGKFTMPASNVIITVTTEVDPYLYVSLTEDDMEEIGSTNAYDNEMTITAGGYTWKTTGYRQGKNSGYIQLKSGTPYIQLPELTGFIQTITFTVTNASATSSTGTAPTTSFEFRTTATGSSVVSAANSGNTLTIDLSGKDAKYSTGYIVSTAGARVWNITIAYTNKLTAEVKSYGWASYIAPAAVSFESGDAYVVTAASVADGLTAEGVSSVPAGTPVLLKGAGTKNITVIASATAPATNLLSVSDRSEEHTSELQSR